MAGYNLITWDASTIHPKRRVSQDITIDFSSVRIGTDQLIIAEKDATTFSFGGNTIEDVASLVLGASGSQATISTAAANVIDVNSSRVTNAASPIANSDLTTKAYVDGVAQGLDVKHSVTAISLLTSGTASGSGVGKTLTATVAGVLTVDGITTWNDMDYNGAVNDPVASNPASRILVSISNPAYTVDNGIYVVKDAGNALLDYFAIGSVTESHQGEYSITDELYQTFTHVGSGYPSYSAGLDYVQVRLKANPAVTGNIVCTVHPNETGGTFPAAIATSAVVDASTLSTTYQDKSFYFNPLVHLQTGVTYAVRISDPTSSLSGDVLWELCTDNHSGSSWVNGTDNVLDFAAQIQFQGKSPAPFILERAIDADEDSEVTAGLFTFVTEGTSYADTGWVLTTDDPITVDTTPQTFTRFSGAGLLTGRAGINIDGNNIDVDLSTNSGLKLTADKLEVALQAAGSGAGGLELFGFEIAVNAGAGVELTADGVAVDLEAAGSATGGLEFSGSGSTSKLKVKAGDGIKLTSNGVEADLAAAGSGSGGLEIASNKIAVNAGAGIELTADGVAVDLEVSGSATGGLEFNGTGATGELKVKVGDGIQLTVSGVEADLAAAASGTGGLEIVSGQIAVDAGNGLELTAGGVAVLGGDGILVTASGVEADLAAAGSGTGGLEIVGAEIAVKVGDGIQLTTSGVEADLAAAGSGTGGLEIVSGQIAVDVGDGIQLTASGVEADLAAAGSGTGGLEIVSGQIAVDVGDGIQLTASGVEADLAAAGSGTGGLEIVSGQIAVDVGDGIQLTASGVEVDLAAAGSGTGGLEIISGQISVDAGAGIELTLDGVAVDLEVSGSATGGLEFNGTGATGELRVKAGGSIKLTSAGVAVDYSEAMTAVEAVAIRDVVYIKTDGTVAKALASTTDLSDFGLGIVEDTTISSGASGKIIIRRGSIVDGFSSLTPGIQYYVDRSTAGAITSDLSGWQVGEFIYPVGVAKNATELIYDPNFILVY